MWDHYKLKKQYGDLEGTGNLNNKIASIFVFLLKYVYNTARKSLVIPPYPTIVFVNSCFPSAEIFVSAPNSCLHSDLCRRTIFQSLACDMVLFLLDLSVPVKLRPAAGTMSGQRRRRWPSIVPAADQRSTCPGDSIRMTKGSSHISRRWPQGGHAYLNGSLSQDVNAAESQLD